MFVRSEVGIAHAKAIINFLLHKQMHVFILLHIPYVWAQGQSKPRTVCSPCQQEYDFTMYPM
jgi:hypothetical protein